MEAFVLSCSRCEKRFSSDNARQLAEMLLAHLEAVHGALAAT